MAPVYLRTDKSNAQGINRAQFIRGLFTFIIIFSFQFLTYPENVSNSSVGFRVHYIKYFSNLSTLF